MFGENLRKAPLIRVIVPFGAGICVGTMFQNSLSREALLILLFIISSLVLVSFTFSIASHHRWLFGLVLMPSLLLLGFIYENIYSSGIFSKAPGKESLYFQLKVTDHVKVSEDWNVFYAKCIADRKDSFWNHSDVSVQLYIAKCKNIPFIEPGEELIVKSSLTRTNEPSNPGAFNYKKYLDHQGIWGTIYLKDSASFIHIERLEKFSLERITYQLQEKFLSVFRKLNIEGDELALLAALTIGVRDEIDNNINKAFAASGAMHILSVSGLHVGIVYLVFSRLLTLLGRKRFAAIFSLFLQIAFLWFYAFLTGLSPAVNRAAAMFSFLAIGKSLNRSANSLNIVSGSALVLIMVNPFLIFDLGFQLSYIAVISIILFQSFIYNLIEFNSYLVDQVWKVTSLSLAAQIGTFPLSIFYFHQFPNYFILTNLVVVPLAAIILYLAISLIFLFWIPFLSTALAWILKISLKGMIFTVMQVEHLPFSVLSNISINTTQMVLLFILIILFASTIHLHSKAHFYTFISCFALFLMLLIAKDFCNFKNHFFIVFQQKGSSVMMAGNKSGAMVLYSGNKSALRLKATSLAKGMSLEQGIKTVQLLCIDSMERRKVYLLRKGLQVCRPDERLVIIRNGNHKIAWLNAGDTKIMPLIDTINADVLVIGNWRKSEELESLKQCRTKKLIFDTSCKASLVKANSAGFIGTGRSAYDVASSGAFLSEN
jgi:competence protein ComEC